MFNVFQLMRSTMGIVQLNAFVAWCKDAAECMRALSGRGVRRSGTEQGKLDGVSQYEIVLTRSNREMERWTSEFVSNSEESD